LNAAAAGSVTGRYAEKSNRSEAAVDWSTGAFAVRARPPTHRSYPTRHPIIAHPATLRPCSGHPGLSAAPLGGMRLPCNFVNVYAKSSKRLPNVYTSTAGSNEKQMVFSYDNSITVSSGQQSLVTSARSL